MRPSQVDRLRCKRELMAMLIQGRTLRKMTSLISVREEQYSQPAVTHYLKGKFVEEYIYQDDSVVIEEKEGYQVRMPKYPPERSMHTQPEIKLMRSMINS